MRNSNANASKCKCDPAVFRTDASVNCCACVDQNRAFFPFRCSGGIIDVYFKACYYLIIRMD